MRQIAHVLMPLLTLGAAVAGDAPATTPITDTAPAATGAKPATKDVTVTLADPSAAVVAVGRQIYRQRDLDALVLIAQRHAKVKFAPADDQRLRLVLTRAFTARESLLDALALLPSAITGKARDAFILDLLDYQGEPAPGGSAAPGAAGSDAPAASQPATAAAADGPVLVRLPSLTLARNLDKLGKRTLTLGLALHFPNGELAKQMEEQAPLMQDAILSHLQLLPAEDFATPDQIKLKAGLTKAVRAKIPAFPSDGILIPQLEVGTGDVPTP